MSMVTLLVSSDLRVTEPKTGTQPVCTNSEDVKFAAPSATSSRLGPTGYPYLVPFSLAATMESTIPTIAHTNAVEN
jgi:hypothetical protein